MGMSDAIGPGTGLPSTDIGWRRYDPIESAHRYINRELSWLDFDARVLALAKDPERPLLERVRFLSIFVANLDGFFQVRVSGLLEQREAGIHQATPDGMTPAEDQSLRGMGDSLSGLLFETDRLRMAVALSQSAILRLKVAHSGLSAEALLGVFIPEGTSTAFEAGMAER